jgi:FtsZ-binding cell division protein ZapB
MALDLKGLGGQSPQLVRVITRMQGELDKLREEVQTLRSEVQELRGRR